MFKHRPQWIGHSLWSKWNISPIEKALWPQENVISWFIAPMEKAWFYKRLFFDVVIVMVKEKKNSIKDTKPIKFSYMHYM